MTETSPATPVVPVSNPTATHLPVASEALVRDEVLQSMLREGTAHDPYYGVSLLSDHLPMTLVSLRRLGATDLQLQTFRDRYTSRLEPQRFAEVPLSGDIWPNVAGQMSAYPGLRSHFALALQQRGRDAVLLEWLPRLIDTAGIDAFHPLIRTALAVEGRCDEELACALAYWVSAWAPVPVADGPRQSIEPSDLFRRLRTHPELGGRAVSTDMFGVQLGQLGSQAAFRSLLQWRSPAVGLPELAREAARIYLSSGLFFALHMVTGTQAANLLSRWINDDGKVADAVWMSLAAAYLIIRTPEYGTPDPLPDDVPSATAVLDAALAAEDEHVAKLGYSAFVEWEAWHLPEHAAILHRIANGTARLGF